MAKRILVVDDDPDIRQVLQDRLDSYGYVVETAIDGQEALDALKLRSYDGMLLDIMMPKVNGLEVLQESRKHRPLMPVVMITASRVKETTIQALEDGAQAFLLKPFDIVRLKTVVDRWFGTAA